MNYGIKAIESSLTRFIARQAALINGLIDDAISKAVLEVERFGVTGGDFDRFSFKEFPALSRRVDGILHTLSDKLNRTVTSGIEWGWDLANAKNDDMVWKVINSIGSTRVPYESPARWMQKNIPALASFEDRRIGGMSLSERVWNLTAPMKGQMELALDLGIGEGASADRLSREVRSYLREPDRLYRRVRDREGVLHLSKSASEYHPGRGVYRSSYKNARRLAATETNMAYRSADHERMKEMPFVLGIEIHLSNNHTCLGADGKPHPFVDICDDLEGRYPAWFKFTGWHPLCRCYTTAILPSPEEMVEYLAAMDENGNSTYEFKGKVEEMPRQFKDWVAGNADRIASAQERGTLPYFLKDNPDAWSLEDDSKDAEIAKALKRIGVEKGDAMSYEEADTKRENPRYKEGGGYRVNCQTCTVTHELRRRGFDVEAKPNIQGSAHKTVPWRERFLTTDGQKVKYDEITDWMKSKGYKLPNEKRLMEFFSEKMAEAGRYEIYVKWAERESAHVFLAESDGKGGIRFFDPQTGDNDSSGWLKSIEKSKTMVLRIDDKAVNPKCADLVIPKG